MLRYLAKYWLLDIKHSPWGKKARRLAGSLLAKLGLNFEDESYRVDGAQSDFATSLTHSASTNATMTSGYGPELVTNGTFDTGNLTGWTDNSSGGGSVVYDNGSALFTTISSSQRAQLSQVYTIPSDGTYQVSVTTSDYSALGDWGIDWNGSAIDFTGSGDGTFSFVFYATAGVKTLNILGTTFAGSVRFDNISVREMPAIKWRPHNLLTYSEDFSNPAWFGINATLVGSLLTATANGGKIQQVVTVPAYSKVTLYVVKGSADTVTVDNGSAGFHDSTIFDLNALSYTLRLNNTDASITDMGGGIIRLTVTRGATAGTRISLAIDTSGETVTLSPNWHLHRNDLGGMVDNPDRGDSYVPTTSSAVYLPRRGHHIYNGYEWVNEGMLHESEARINIFEQSSPSSISYNGNIGVASPTKNQTNPFTTEGDAAIITASAGTGGHYAGSNVHFSTPAAAITITTTVWVERGTSRYVFFEVFGPGPTYEAAYVVDLDTLSSTTLVAADVAFNVVEVSPDVYALSISDTTNGSVGTPYVRVGPHDGSASASWTAAGTETVKLLAVQTEIGASNTSAATPSSYIPTSGSTVTRAAESLTIPAANLPWPTPNVIGSELVTNGTFDTDLTGWSVGTGLTAVQNNGVAEVTRTGAINGNDAFRQDVTVEVGKIYLISYTASNADVARTFTSGSSTTGAGSIGVGDLSDVLYAAATTLSLNFWTGTGQTVYLDNISVKEIDPLAVSIQMNGRMTYADGIFGVAEPYRWRTNDQNRIFISVDSSLSPDRWYFTQVANNIQDYVFASEDLSGVFVPFNIASRHGSTFINGAADGIAFTANTTPTALPDLSATDLSLAYDFMGTIRNFQIWDRDIGDTGLVDETAPSLEPSLFLTFDGTTGSYTVRDWSE